MTISDPMIAAAGAARARAMLEAAAADLVAAGQAMLVLVPVANESARDDFLAAVRVAGEIVAEVTLGPTTSVRVITRDESGDELEVLVDVVVPPPPTEN